MGHPLYTQFVCAEWYYTYLIKGKCFWTIIIKSDSCSTWRKVLKLGSLARSFMRHIIGNGATPSYCLITGFARSPLLSFLHKDYFFLREFPLQPRYTWSFTIVNGLGLFLLPYFLPFCLTVLKLTRFNRLFSRPKHLLLLQHGMLLDLTSLLSIGINFCGFLTAFPRHNFIFWMVIQGNLRTKTGCRNGESSSLLIVTTVSKA